MQKNLWSASFFKKRGNKTLNKKREKRYQTKNTFTQSYQNHIAKMILHEMNDLFLIYLYYLILIYEDTHTSVMKTF